MDVYARVLVFDPAGVVIPLQTAVAADDVVDDWIARLLAVLDAAHESGCDVSFVAQTFREE